ncbi:hypothetical protein FHS83_002098 [Rhizomicrobium palustre]|uniref:DUF3604 domain-containing protein n=1 Tax=Rhizomicrobium palustre TaxID=189966 RepID=A0A846N0T5_9PROT|nr:DUF3604 domain-containing protein [Rhizomicrobium palustre]NIK88780.1 hypothetical protein [Rhizomicrobium palustre]
MRKILLSTAAALAVSGAAMGQGGGIAVHPEREAYYGDLHLHTSYSFDAYVLLGTKVDPDAAYRFAKGEPVDVLGQQVRRREPLDFLAVTDHSENIGVAREADIPGSAIAQSAWGRGLQADRKSLSTGFTSDRKGFLELLTKYFLGDKDQPQAVKDVAKSAWEREVSAANHNNQPGKFTAFVAYEWSSLPNGANLHRNVIFKGDKAPSPFSSLDSQNPEKLWDWLDQIRKDGYEALAIPHNANASNGLMYDWNTYEGRPIDLAWALRRAENEPLSEISQNKGQSETIPALSPNDEFADFEVWDTLLVSAQKSKPGGSYVRDALSRGLVLQKALGVNPYKYGIVGASDIHSGLSVSAQQDYPGYASGKPGVPTKEEATAVLNSANGASIANRLRGTSGNLTGIWAESNTRDSLYAGLRRKETFATSGTRLKFRFFGGWNLDSKLVSHGDWVKEAYAKGVPMGGDLPVKPGAAKGPSFAVWAAKDPNSANLDRVQIIKVWEEGGQQKEKIFDVAWSGNRSIDPKTRKLRAVGNTVDLKTGAYDNSIGATELKTVWRDPEFDPKHLAAYYVRVLEIPTPRWSTLLAIANQLPLPKSVALTEQQRGWSSPIWYTPKK